MDLWKSDQGRIVLIYVAAGIALFVAILILGDEVWRHITTLESWIEGLGPWAFVVFILLYVILNSIFFPDTFLGIIAGTMFSFPQALATVICGSIAAALLQYALSRHLLKPVVNKLLASKPTLCAIQTAVLHQELRLQFLIRLTPLNRALVSYLLGAAGISLSRFVLAFTGILPNLCLEVYFGYLSKHLANANNPEHGGLFHDAMLMGGFMAAAAVMVIISKMARRAVEEATAKVLLY